MRLLLGLILILASSSVFSQEIEHDHSINYAFIENMGQWNDQILFRSHFSGGNLWVQQRKLLFHIQDFSATQSSHANFANDNLELANHQTVVHLNFLGANEVEEIEKEQPTPFYLNYFHGNDSEKWASNVHGYSEATLKDLYNGIDLKLIEEKRQLKYEFHVKPGTSPSEIGLEYVGQESIKINRQGELVVKTILGEIIEQKPYAYQIVNGKIVEVACEFQLIGNVVSFELGEYLPHVDLVIDPVLIFATYSGSVTDNFGMTATYGYDGTAFSGGIIYGNAYPTPDNNAYDISSNFTVTNNGSGQGYGVTDVFVSHYSSDGTNMLWTTFIGGGDDTQGTETVHSLICDQNNNLYLFGATSSIDFPIQSGYQSSHAGGADSANFYQNGVFYKTQGTDIYVAKFSADGQSLLGSTYIGGSKNDGVNYKDNMPFTTVGAAPFTYPAQYYTSTSYDSLTSNYGDQFRGEIMLDESGNCIVASCTKSNDFPLQNAFQPGYGGKQDGVVFKLSSDLSTLIWSSYYGGSNYDACYSVKVDSSDNIVFAGGTCSPDLPGINGWQLNHNGGKADGFVAKLTPAGAAITNASYIGTNNYDQAFFVEIDRDDNVFLVGQSQGGNFPVVNAGYQNSGSSQFLIKLTPDLLTNLNSTVFGNGSGIPNISPAAFLVDICGNIYVSGWGANILQSSVTLNGMPVTADAIYQNPPNGFDFYLLVVERDMADILYGSYFGEPGQIREHVDGGTSRFDKDGVVYQSVCGACGAEIGGAVTTPGAWSSQDLSPNCNNLLFKFDFQLIPEADFTVDNNMGCEPFTVTFDNFSTDSDSYLWDFGNGDTTSVVFEPVITFDSAGTYQVFLYVTDSICLLTDTAEVTIFVSDSLELTTISDQQLCVPENIDFTAYTNGAATTFVWSSNSNFTDTLNTDLTDSVWTYQPTSSGTYYIQASNTGCVGVDSVNVEFIGSSLVLSANDSICAGETTVITAGSTNSLITFDTYVWGPDTILVSPSSTNQATVNPTVNQYVVVTATSSNGCTATDSIQIFVGDIPLASVSASASENSVAEGTTVTLYGTPSGMSYEWSPGTGVTNVNAQNTEALVEETTVYTLKVTDGICLRTDTTLVEVFTFICGNPYVYVPNAFSPNGDGENEVLYVRGVLVEEMLFRVFDRWGELVFESIDRGNGWDGTFRGKPMDPDTYDYYLKVTCIGGDEEITKGNVTLLR